MNGNSGTNLLVCVVGPTGTGKSKVGIELAKYYLTEIISADSRQVYRYLDIGTNKITVLEAEGIKHHLIDCVNPDEHYNAGQFARDAEKIINELFKSHNIVLLVGGSDLYIRALVEGFDPTPEVNDSIKLQLDLDLSEKGLHYLVDELAKADPATYAKIDKSNPARIIRALEICRATGQPYSEFMTGKTKVLNYNVIYLVIFDDRNLLYQRINNRVHSMLQNGLLEEVEKLLLKYPDSLKAFHTIGYKECIGYLQNEFSFENMISQIQQHTRNYAKRQLTWQRTFSQKYPDKVNWLSPDEIEKMILLINQKLER